MTTVITNGHIVLMDRFYSVEKDGEDDPIMGGFHNKYRTIHNPKVVKEYLGIDFEPQFAVIVGSVSIAESFLKTLEEPPQMLSFRQLVELKSFKSDFSLMLLGREEELFVIDNKETISYPPGIFKKGTWIEIKGSGLEFRDDICPSVVVEAEEDLHRLFLVSTYFDKFSSYDYDCITLGKKPVVKRFNPTEEEIADAFSHYFNPTFYQPEPKVREPINKTTKG